MLTIITVLASRRPHKLPQRDFFGYVYLKKMRVEYPSIMNFEDHSASGLQAICDLFVTYTDDPWASSGPDLLNDDPPFGSLQLTVWRLNMRW
jgi:hypothetical protein